MSYSKSHSDDYSTDISTGIIASQQFNILLASRGFGASRMKLVDSCDFIDNWGIRQDPCLTDDHDKLPLVNIKILFIAVLYKQKRHFEYS